MAAAVVSLHLNDDGDGDENCDECVMNCVMYAVHCYLLLE